MFHLVHGPCFQHGKAATVVFGYFDESNTHKGSKIISLCGFLADPRIWEDFDREWKRVLDKRDWPNRPSEFHMYPCVHGLKPFLGWTLAERLAIYGDMVSLLCDTNLIALGSVIDVTAFENLSEQYKTFLRQGGLTLPIDFVFQHALQVAVGETVHYDSIHTPPITEELGLLFDDVEPALASRYYLLYDHVKAKHQYGSILTGIGFGSSEKFTPLQAADMLAYTTYHYTLKRYYPSESDFDFPIHAPFIRLVDRVATAGGVFSEKALITLVGQELINEINKGFRL